MSDALTDFDGLLNWDRLQAWIALQDVPGSGPVTAVRQLQGGSQNNIFILERGPDRVVLRRPPTHPRPKSNETMLREAAVLKALKGSAVPHAEFHAVCDDLSVMGVCFYLMAPLEGFTPRWQLPEPYASDPNWRYAMGDQMVHAIAALGGLDHRAIGLEGFGKPENWHARQVDRWRSQLEGYRELPGYQGSQLPHVDDVGRWLADNAPVGGRIGVIHGDYQFGNVMFQHARPRLAGLIDWELSTLGDPLLDLGWVLASWKEPGDPELRDRGMPLLPWTGFMTRADLVSLYGALSGRDMSDMPWYFVLACYKLGCILEGTYARSLAGLAPPETGVRLHNGAPRRSAEVVYS